MDTRYLTPLLLKDLEKKMVFISGPRQCGKTTLVKQILSSEKSGQYFNWDHVKDKKRILNEIWSDEDRLLVFDEIHKYPRWKNLIKGYFDTQNHKHRFLVTGSARLDVYRRGGDSLLGRYHHWRLHPFSLSEIPEKMKRKEAFNRLMQLGGFPEPFLDGDENFARRWRRERSDRILKEDVRDLESLKDIQMLMLLAEMLKERVGSLVVVSNLAEDLQVAPATVSKWIEVLERMYYIFVVRPYTKNVARSLQKPFKVYFFDNADVQGDIGAVFENFVATHLLKKLHFLEDSTGYRYGLHFIRDKEKREVDFAITRDGKAEVLIEAKFSDPEPSKHLIHFSEKLNVQAAIQIGGPSISNRSKNRLKLQNALESEWLRL